MKTNSERMGKGVRFVRLRRITGYLVSSLERWNSAKQAEERDRVKHTMNGHTINSTENK